MKRASTHLASWLVRSSFFVNTGLILILLVSATAGDRGKRLDTGMRLSSEHTNGHAVTGIQDYVTNINYLAAEFKFWMCGYLGIQLLVFALIDRALRQSSSVSSESGVDDNV